MSLVIVLIIVLLLVGALQTWPYSAHWGYAPCGIIGVMLIIVLIAALMGRL